MPARVEALKELKARAQTTESPVEADALRRGAHTLRDALKKEPSGAVAALACRRFFKFEAVLPCHYATFPMIDQTAEKFVTEMEGSATKVLTPKVGGTVEL